MNCFQHPQKAAVGHCTYCGRGLCLDCATNVEGKLSCRGECEQEIARERKFIAHSEAEINKYSRVYATSAGIYQGSFAFFAVLGILILALGALLLLAGEPAPGVMSVAIGILFLLYGVRMARAGKNFKALGAEGRDGNSQS